MLPVQLVSSIVTAATASIFVLIIRNLDEKPATDNETVTNEALNSAILAELSAETEANEIDYELLEEKLKLLDCEDNFVDIEAEKKETVEVFETQSSQSNDVASVSDLTIEVTHNIRNKGQHRPYTLSMHFMPRPK